VLVVGTACAARAAPATQPASERLSRAVRDLADERFEVRERASEELFQAGPAATAMLKEAAEEGPPEARLRAQTILARFAHGVYPDTPGDIAALAERYDAGDEDQKASLLMELARRGPYGCVVILKLAETEANLELKDLVARLLGTETKQAPQSAAILIGGGDADAARRLLKAAADGGEEAAVRAYAALLLSRGQLDATLRQLQGRADRGGEVEAMRLAPKLAWFYRAAGDLGRAASAAEAAHDEATLETLALERRDWKRLASLLTKRTGGDRETALRQMGFLAAAQRLAGDEAACDQTLAAVRRIASHDAGSTWTGASILLLNERLDGAVEMLVERQEYVTAFGILSYAGRYEEALGLLEADRRQATPKDEARLAAKTAALWWRLGERDKAKALIEEAQAAAGAEPQKGFAVRVALVEAEREMGRTEPAIAAKARAHAVEALEVAGGNDSLPALFEKLYPRRGTVAGQWWDVIAPGAASKAEALEALDGVMAGRLTAAQWEPLVERANDTTVQPQVDALRLARRYQLVIDTLQSAGQSELAGREFDKLAGLLSWVKNLPRETYLYIADGYGRRGDWAKAGQIYEACANHHGNAPDLVWLRGYAMQQVDPKSGGGEMMARAGELSLADERRMALLADAMANHGHGEEAMAQRRAILRLGHPRGWTWYDECKTLGNELARRKVGEPEAAAAAAEAADLWQLFALQVLDSGGTFAEDLAYVQLPQLVRTFRARGYYRAGKTAEAMAELAAFLKLSPTHIEAALDAVPEMKKLRQEPAAREVFDRVYKPLEGLCAKYPQSAYFQNEAAWLAVKCGYEGDAALAHAKRAVELSPRDTASIDTLAEILYRRGEKEQALELMKRCEELEPDQARHRQRREQLEKGTLSDE
jgi:hypothetical protein